jgi:hypothetical protein
VWVRDKFNDLVDFFRDLPGRVTDAMSTLGNAILSPFKSAFNAVANAWNNTIGKWGFTIPSWVPIWGGNSWNMPDIPTFHTGGVFKAPAGQTEGLALLRDGERILPGSRAADTGVVINVHGFVGSELDLAAEIDRVLTRRARTSGLGFA